MSFHQLIDNLIIDTVGSPSAIGSLQWFRPEIILCVTILIMLLARVIGARGYTGAVIALAGTCFALWQAYALATFSQSMGDEVSREIFTGLLVIDSFTLYMRVFLLFTAALFIVFTLISGIPDQSDGADFYSLVLGAIVGMCIMVEANHLLMIFLGIEMASVPSYVMVGILKGRRQSSEAALKYAIYGAGTAGIMLYGISLLAGVIGSAHLPTMAAQLADMNPATLDGGQQMVLILGGLMLMVGLSFKLAAVPFHFWCPDAFEGAPAEVGGFLSVVSKAAALALLVRVALGFGYIPEDRRLVRAPAVEVQDAQKEDPNASATIPGEAKKLSDERNLMSLNPGGDIPDELTFTFTEGEAAVIPSVTYKTSTGEIPEASAEPTSSTRESRIEALKPVRRYMALLVGVLAMITCTFGNLAAYAQTNLKRLLAYSTIAHAGYMMMPVAAALVLVNQGERVLASEAISSLVVYITIYMFMNFGAFAIVAFLRNATFSEEIDHFGGLYKTAPGVVICLGVIFFSLLGMPPLAGFVAKFAIFVALVTAGGWLAITMLVVAGINTALSLYYYLRVIKVMAIDPEPEDRPPIQMSLFPSIPGAYILMLTLPILIFGIWPEPLFRLAAAATKSLL